MSSLIQIYFWSVTNLLSLLGISGGFIAVHKSIPLKMFLWFRFSFLPLGWIRMEDSLTGRKHFRMLNARGANELSNG